MPKPLRWLAWALRVSKSGPRPKATSPKTGKPPPLYIAHLSSGFNRHIRLPEEVTYVEIEPHGALSLYRYISGEHAQYFELSRAELDALIDVCEQHRQLRERDAQKPNLGGGPSVDQLGTFPF
jgi:hypothetical protein